MELTHRLRVPARPDEVWTVVLDPRRLAELLPGTVVDSVAGDSFTGTMKIKLASSLLVLAGSGRYVSTDDGARGAVVTTEGADRRGDAGVEARHTISLAPAAGSPAETEVTVTTTSSWTGRPARLGEGVVADAVQRVVEHVGERITARVAEGLPWAPSTPDARGATTAEAVVDHPVELGDDLGDLDAPDPSRPAAAVPAPSPSPSPAPRPPRPAQPEAYVYRPYDNAAEPHLEAVRTFSRVVVRRLVPYAGLAALGVFALAGAVRRIRR
ncbi:SRPBCC domain-containing protein [Microlunatus flavus]|uniref:Carbon monoxide dehydrogenase subunit G n=1 Tax=Microlunatus flavus TaxID=1036181 RepID=A0A1H9ESG5_9ACTN|nr:SRPBCC domain-containing protein [Microlunatus flavus]SEQ28634.1 Carbon monoxide dehydrogenase subunit G [Microlunatus flavus]